MARDKYQEKQYKLPLDVPANVEGQKAETKIAFRGSYEIKQDAVTACKIYSFAAATQKIEHDQQEEALRNILAHSEALDW